MSGLAPAPTRPAQVKASATARFRAEVVEIYTYPSRPRPGLLILGCRIALEAGLGQADAGVRSLIDFSAQVDGVRLEVVQRDVLKGALMRGPQGHTRRTASLQRLAPTWGAHAPAVPGSQPRKTDPRHRGD